MSNGLRVIDPGLYTTVQDFGRYGYQQFGVPVSGALDTDSLRLANALVGNAAGEPAVEILHAGPTLEVTAASARIAIGGFGAGVEMDGHRIDAWRSLTLERGQRFRVVLGPDSGVCYLAIAGGLDLPPVLGSCSTYARSAIGGYQGRRLESGDHLALNTTADKAASDLQLSQRPDAETSAPIRCTWGPQKDYFTDRSLEAFATGTFTIGADADRMGLRLAGPVLEHRGSHDIVSDGIATGAVQVPGNGRPIVLMADRQTTGGYPKLANVISADLPVLGRRRPGQEVRFQVIEVAEAERIRRARERELRVLEENLEPAAAGPWIDLDALYSENLISGVIRDD